MRLLKVRLLNVSGVEYEIVEENLLKLSVVECEAQKVLSLSGVETK